MLCYVSRGTRRAVQVRERCAQVQHVHVGVLAQTEVKDVQDGVRWGARRTAGRPAI